MDGIIIDDKTYVLVEYTKCTECDVRKYCNNRYCKLFEHLHNGSNYMFKEIKIEENSNTI